MCAFFSPQPERNVIVTPRPPGVSTWRVSRPCKRWTTLAVAMVFAGCSQRHTTTPNPILEAQSSGTTALLQAVAVTSDGGATWVLGGRLALPGAAYGSSFVPGGPDGTLVAVGPGGAAYSLDDGSTWTSLGTLSHWAVGFANPAAGWAVGPGGRITKIRLFP